MGVRARARAGGHPHLAEDEPLARHPRARRRAVCRAREVLRHLVRLVEIRHRVSSPFPELIIRRLTDLPLIQSGEYRPSARGGQGRREQPIMAM